jgi:hypothetical protein
VSSFAEPNPIGQFGDELVLLGLVVLGVEGTDLLEEETHRRDVRLDRLFGVATNLEAAAPAGQDSLDVPIRAILGCLAELVESLSSHLCHVSRSLGGR